MDRDSLLAKIQELEAQGLDISLKKVQKAVEKDKLTGPGELAYYRKKIRHLVRDTEESAEDKARRAELNAFPMRKDPAKGLEGLREDVAGPMYQGGDSNVKLILNNYTSMSKGDLISAIIKAEKYIRENGVAITAPVKKSVPKLSVKTIEDDEEVVRPAIVASPRASPAASPRPSLVKPSVALPTLAASPRAALPTLAASPRPSLVKPSVALPTLAASPQAVPAIVKPTLAASPRPVPAIVKPTLAASPQAEKPTLAASPRAVPKLTIKKVDEEVAPPAGQSSSRMKTPINAPLPKTEKYGKYDYEELLKKKVGELKEILKRNKIQEADVKTSEEAADMISQISKYKQGCSEEDPCEDGLICDVDSKPGICVDSGVASKKPAWFEYNGQQFVGSTAAIENLRQMVGGQESKTMPADSALVAKAMKLSGKPREYFGKMNQAQLKLFIEGVDVEEKRRGGLKRELITRLSEVYEKPAESFRGMSLSDLNNMLEDAEDQHILAAQKLGRKTGEHPDTYDLWSIPEIERKVAEMEKPKAGKKKISLGEDEDEEQEIKEVIAVSPSASPLPSPRRKIMLGDDDEEEEVKPMFKPAQSLLKPLTIAPEKKVQIRQQQENIGVEDVDAIIQDVLVGKGEIDQFSDVQKAVVQCLGLLQA